MACSTVWSWSLAPLASALTAVALSSMSACGPSPAPKPASRDRHTGAPPPSDSDHGDGDAGRDTEPSPEPEPADALPDDPLRLARATIGQLDNREASIPPACYTKTQGAPGSPSANPCWVCHSASSLPNAMHDWELQGAYSFSETGRTNQWTNLFRDRREAVAAIDDATMLAWVREDNYTPLREFLATLEDAPRLGSYRGYRPDLDFVAGFDEGGWAVDGSGWRAFRFKPFPGAFWPTNGSTDDVAIRLPQRYREREDGTPSPAVYAVNLAILEASMASDPRRADAALRWPTEPLSELAAGVDLDGDGELEEAVTELRGLPQRYVGGASKHSVRRRVYPEGTEFIHSVRYLDPDAPGMVGARMKELRYSYKKRELSDSRMLAAYGREAEEKAEGGLPLYGGSPLSGMSNDFGWVLQAFIEDGSGRLRVQTEEEHYFCMGCHSNLGVTADQTFAFPRKLPGEAGWAYQSLAGMPDAPQVGHERGEVAVYLERALAGDEYRGNAEMIERWLTDAGALDAAALDAAEDLAALVTPSRERALALDKAYLVLVREQSFTQGRDPVLTPVETVHRTIEAESTGLSEADEIYTDGRLQLAWPRP